MPAARKVTTQRTAAKLTSIRGVPPRPHFRLADADDVLKIDEIVAVYRLSESTIRKRLARRVFVPKPFAIRPFRWLKQDVEADLASRRTVRDTTTEGEPVRRRLRRPSRRAADATTTDATT